MAAAATAGRALVNSNWPSNMFASKERPPYPSSAARAARFDSFGPARPSQRRIGAGSRRFNPAQGGYVQTRSRRRIGRRRTRKRTTTRKQIRRIRRTIKKAKMARFSKIKGQYVFPLQTSATYPLTTFPGPYGQTVSPVGITTSGNCPGAVGWNIIDEPANKSLNILYDTTAVESLPWIDSTTSEARVVNFGDLSAVKEQLRFHHKLSWDLWFRNNSNSVAEVDLYLCKALSDCVIGPLTEINRLRQAAYSDGTDPLIPNDPFPITEDFDQYISVPHSGGQKREWGLVKKVKMVLNPGDESRQFLSYSCTLPYSTLATDVDQLQFCKGSWAMFARIQGGLVVDKTNPSLVAIGGATVGVWMSRDHEMSVSKNDYTNVHRLVTTVPMTIAGPVVAAAAAVDDLTM